MSKTAKTVKSDQQINCIVEKLALLRTDKGKTFTDIQINVGGEAFLCHKLVLFLSTNYFTKLISTTSPSTERCIIVLPEFKNPTIFNNVLNFIYKGEVDLTEENVGDMLEVAKVLSLDNLKLTCLKFMEETLDLDNCIKFWRMALDYGMPAPSVKIYESYMEQNFDMVYLSTNLKYVTENMMKVICMSDSIILDSEVKLLEMLLKWIEIMTRNGRQVRVDKLLPLIRWADIDAEYVKSTLLANSYLKDDPNCFKFLSQVISFILSGIQFEGLLTFYRPATGLRKCFVGIAGKCDVFLVNLQNKNSVIQQSPMPTSTANISIESVGCVRNNLLYVSGIGAGYKEIWRYDYLTGWTRCVDLIIGRRRHCMVSVGNNLYILGGYIDSTMKATDSVEQFHSLSNKCKQQEHLSTAVCSAACVAYKNCIYIFGGKDDTGGVLQIFDYVQCYDPAKQSCTLFTTPIPKSCSLAKAVLWQSSAILFNHDTCLIFDLEAHIWQERCQFKTNVNHFGIALENQMVYIIGGRSCKSDTDDGGLTGKVKCITVSSIVKDQDPVWTEFANISKPSLIFAHGTLSMPI